MTPVLVFDIETIPDVTGLRRLRGEWSALSDADVAERAFSERREKTGNDFLPLHLHRVVAISCVLRSDAGFRVGSIGSLADGEGSLIQAFFGMIDRYTPQLVSWNGGGFDLPVLHYRGLLAGVSAARYWDLGEDDRDFRYNNYIGRYHMRHLDLMDLLAMYQPRASAPLDDLSKLAGFGGKLGMDGARVWDAYQAGQLEHDSQLLRDGCRQHVPAVQPLPENARRAERRAAPRRGSARPRHAHASACAALAGVPRSVARGLGHKPGDEFPAEVESLDQEGRGVAHRDGKAVFIEGALPRERVIYERRKNKPSYETGRVVRIDRASALRVVAPLSARRPAPRRVRRLLDAAHRAPARRYRSSSACSRTRCGISAASGPRRMLRPIAGPAWEYRYRARLSVRHVAKKGGVLVGFHERGSSYVADIRQCEVMPRHVSDLLLPAARSWSAH